METNCFKCLEHCCLLLKVTGNSTWLYKLHSICTFQRSSFIEVTSWLPYIETQDPSVLLLLNSGKGGNNEGKLVKITYSYFYILLCCIGLCHLSPFKTWQVYNHMTLSRKREIDALLSTLHCTTQTTMLLKTLKQATGWIFTQPPIISLFDQKFFQIWWTTRNQKVGAHNLTLDFTYFIWFHIFWYILIYSIL